jgi:hypothetical protein
MHFAGLKVTETSLRGNPKPNLWIAARAVTEKQHPKQHFSVCM